LRLAHRTMRTLPWTEDGSDIGGRKRKLEAFLEGTSEHFKSHIEKYRYNDRPGHKSEAVAGSKTSSATSSFDSTCGTVTCQSTDTTSWEESTQATAYSGEETLCSRCSRIDFDSAFRRNTRIPISGRKVFELGAITDARTNVSCPLCRLFAAVDAPRHMLATERAPDYHLRVFNLAALASFGFHKEVKQPVRDSTVVLGVIAGSNVRQLDPADRALCFRKGVIAEASRVPKPLDPTQDARAYVLGPSVNYSQIRNWIEFCDEWHKTSCVSASGPTFLNLWFIDCSTRAVVRPHEPIVQYFALSYVWNSVDGDVSGKQSPASTSRFPKLIEDAITLVSGIGGRYLWVDRYCINQSDKQERHTVIRNMDKVYASARATIVAVDDPSSHPIMPGLPGIGATPRQAQSCADIGSRVLASTLPDLSCLLDESSWIKRGWTYQEATLSRRCLFVTSQQVYYVCRAMRCCEALDNYFDLTRSDLLTDTFLSVEALSFPDKAMKKLARDNSGARSTCLFEFFMHLEKYKSRNLTFESDMLNAFQGMLSVFNFENIWGVPIAIPRTLYRNDLNIIFDVGLARGLWWTRKMYYGSGPDKISTKWRRIRAFPSWSWAGWEGPISRLYPSSRAGPSEQWCNCVNDDEFDCHFSFELSNETHITVQDYFKRGGLRDEYKQITHALICEGDFVTLKFDRTTATYNKFGEELQEEGPPRWTLSDQKFVSGKGRSSEQFLLTGKEDPELYSGASSQEFTCFCLFRDGFDDRGKKTGLKSYQRYRLLILNKRKNEDDYERIGSVEMDAEVFRQLQRTRRTVRIV
jgi:hypothetical protein